ncbi:MAG: hypothetical protein KDA96_11675 [Planctomycetaceae bacterium]|nr:hypothetical protein [Planctomycetaceae bacterium]
MRKADPPDGTVYQSEGGTDAPRQDLLDQILHLTQQNVSLSDSDKATVQNLRQAALELGDVPFSRDPVLSSLVASLLKPFGLLSPSQFAQMSASVTSTIYDDAAARERAGRVWEALRRSVRHAE